MTDSRDTASISFTGLYTGEVWYRNGLSPRFLSTRSGAGLYHAMTPFESASRWLGGNNLRVVLVQRHLLMDHLLEQLIREAGVSQVLEIASGMSPRGYRFRKRFPQVTYVETDIPGMAQRKRRELEAAGCLGDRHRVLPLDVFHSDGERALETVVSNNFREGEPLVIITEGLTSYFTLADMEPFWQRLAALGDRFPGSRYLMETYYLPESGVFSATVQRLALLLGRLSDSTVSFHFRNDEEIRSCFGRLGFSGTRVHDPADYYELLPVPRSRRQTLVRIVEGAIG
ncbi:leucine carboxyl methyltransferase [Halospina denitrificans]|uniref:Leucine carboxyl methyltransferase n=1 Tax=Halospina denitrificans TaxID=332522 RepID=A0A4R7K1C7_9GAMM|nr:class I SAM-dependent methyltransferase [Halospina denitrificans]TDT44385.1 leucine carboxyl methyltransferase [Halospina denitrificans]